MAACNSCNCKGMQISNVITCEQTTSIATAAATKTTTRATMKQIFKIFTLWATTVLNMEDQLGWPASGMPSFKFAREGAY